MPKENPENQPTFSIGDVGAHATIQQGQHQMLYQSGRSGTLADLGSLLERFALLRNQIAADPKLDEATKSLSEQKLEAMQNAIGAVGQNPQALQFALLDSKNWFSSAAHWVWDGIRDAMLSEVGQKTLGAIAEGTTKAAIAALLGGA